MFWTQRTRIGQILANALAAGGFMAFYALADQPGLLLLLLFSFSLLFVILFLFICFVTYWSEDLRWGKG